MILYITKKETLLEEKTALQEKLHTAEGVDAEWLEPALLFLNQVKSIEKIALSANLSEKANLFREVGLNRKLHQFSVQYEPRGAWRVLQQQGERSERRFFKQRPTGKNTDTLLNCCRAGIRT